MPKLEVKSEFLILPDKKRTIQRFSEMDTPTLVDEIERFFRWRNRLDYFFDIFDEIYLLMGKLYPQEYGRKPSDKQSANYVVSLFRTKRGLHYINNLKTILCEGRLSKILGEVEQASYLQQVDYLSEYLAQVNLLHSNLTYVNSTLIAVFILRIGIDKFCE